ncbi:MAG: 2OG-Fe(II) oxygenase [Vulcanimicrobiaceae bacterium]
MTRDPSLKERLEGLESEALSRSLWADGFARISGLMAAEQCASLIAAYDDDALYRTTVVMARHGFGRGTYRYFADPLPKVVGGLRSALYRNLAPLANAWNEALRLAERYPPELEAYLAECAKAGQLRPTPLVLRYEAGDYNALHQDLYGERAFPLQVTIGLSERVNYSGGESVLVMQRPRAQSVARVVTLEGGDALVFPTRYRPVEGTHGTYRQNVRHGVSEVRSGLRFALGVIFHNAR